MRTHMEDLLASGTRRPPPDRRARRSRLYPVSHPLQHAARRCGLCLLHGAAQSLRGKLHVIEGLRRDYETRLEAILRRGVAEGAFAVTEPRIAAMALIAMLTGVNTWFREGGRLSLGEVEALYWDMVRRAVANHG